MEDVQTSCKWTKGVRDYRAGMSHWFHPITGGLLAGYEGVKGLRSGLT